jgi:uncharacterized 2Fe-2S/4Fe-4S cluster protein (DUF4445 family)
MTDMPAVVEASEPSNVRRWVQTVTLAPPTLKDNTADADRLAAALKGRIGVSRLKIGLPMLQTLPDRLRRWHYRARCLLFQDGPVGQLVALTAPDDAAPLTGLAVDLGTTRVVLRLVDLESGRTLGESAFDNPQIAVGPDILVRIQHAESDSGCDALRRLIVDGLNAHIDDLSHSCGLRAEDVYLAAVAGNTAMTHLFMGLPARWIIREPYTPAVNRPGVLSAAALGLRVNPAGRVLVFPNIGSYFGGDLIAGILFAGLHRREATAILVDVGTNAEVVVGNRHWLMGCAGAAGPALEGGVSAIGMMAGPGVVDRVRIDPVSGAFEVHTIGDLAPRGICGSGVIDLAAQLFLAGMVDIRGKLRAEVCGDRWRELDGLAHLVVVPASSASGRDLTISQADLDSLVRSKAAMYTILRTLTGTLGLAFEDLEAFYVAGTFGAFIDPRSAIAIGMLPDLPLATYQTLGNSSLGGATLALCDAGRIGEIDAIRDAITYLELNVNQEFMNRFSAAKFLPHTDPARFPSVKPFLKRTSS